VRADESKAGSIEKGPGQRLMVQVLLSLADSEARLIQGLLQAAEADPANQERLTTLRNLRHTIDGFGINKKYLSIYIGPHDVSIGTNDGFKAALDWLCLKRRLHGEGDQEFIYDTNPVELLWRGGRKASPNVETIANNRRSPRQMVKIPVLVSWNTNGLRQEAPGETEVANVHGALIHLGTLTRPERSLTILNLFTREKRDATLVYQQVQPNRVSVLIGVELEEAGGEFWGL